MVSLFPTQDEQMLELTQLRCELHEHNYRYYVLDNPQIR
jgi:NAD-dependent DNA ligase